MTTISAGGTRSWATHLCFCSIIREYPRPEEHEIWQWSLPCCCIISLRNNLTFGFSSYWKQVIGYTFILLIALFLTLYQQYFLLLGFLCLSAIVSACFRAKYRQQIRQQLNLQSAYYLQDYCIHLLFPSCAVAQEAREIELHSLEKYDYCSTQKIEEIFDNPNHPPSSSSSRTTSARNHNNNNNSHLTVASSLFAHHRFFSANYMRQCSDKLIFSQISGRLLYGTAIVFTMTLIWLIVHRPYDVFPFLLALLIPIVILFYFCWIESRIDYVYLDYIWKCFFVGGTFTFFGYLFIVFLLTKPLELANMYAIQVDYFYLNPVSFAINWDQSAAAGFSNSLIMELLLVCGLLALINAFLLFLESMKLSIVRSCLMPSTVLQHPSEILMYLLSGSLGFMTAENLWLIFTFSPQFSLVNGFLATERGSTTMSERELWKWKTVLIVLKYLLPIQLITPWFQSIRLLESISKRERNDIGKIIRIALYLHIIFDYFPIVYGLICYRYDPGTYGDTDWMKDFSNVFTIGLLGLQFLYCLVIGNIGYRRFSESESRRHVQYELAFATDALRDDESVDGEL